LAGRSRAKRCGRGPVSPQTLSSRTDPLPTPSPANAGEERKMEPEMDAGPIEARKARARTWFERLRDDICAAFEALEDELPAGVPFAERPAGRFVRTPWSRTDHTGGQLISGLPEIGTSSAGSAKADR